LFAEQGVKGAAYLDSILYDEEKGRLRAPSFVFSDPVTNEIYVIDSQSRFIIYTKDFFPLFTVDRKKGIVAPQGLTLDADGTIYVVMGPSQGNPRSRIAVYNASLRWVRDMYFTGFEGSDEFIPYRIAVDRAGNLYVTGNFYPGVLVLDNKGKFIEKISPDEEGKEAQLNNVTIDASGRIYIVSTAESKIYVYNENKAFLFKFGEKGGSSTKLSQPMAVGIDRRNGRIYVVDYMRHSINAYDREGKYLFEFGGMGWGEGWFQFPRDLAVDSAGRILVADTFNNRIEVFQPNE
jgi:DNA-binding beta-propeller fold protein YncE